MEMNEFDLGFVVGILEGEGSVAVYLSKRIHGEPYLAHRIVITNTDLDLLNRLVSILGENGVIVRANRVRPNRLPSYSLYITKQEVALDFLKTVKPHLISGKLNRRCELVIEWLKIRIEHYKTSGFLKYHSGGYSEREWEIYKELRVTKK